MKMLSVLLALFVLFSFDKKAELEIGTSTPMVDYKMMDISGKEVSLDETKKENGLLVIFSCNTCPWVLAWEDRYNEIADLAKENKIGIIFVNSNEGKRDGVDSLEEMKKHAKKMKYNFLYTVDKDNKLADAFGATKTPHVYLFNNKSMLVYRGAIDDNAKNKDGVKKPYLKNALSLLAGDKEIKTKTTKSIGCSIKRI